MGVLNRYHNKQYFDIHSIRHRNNETTVVDVFLTWKAAPYHIELCKHKFDQNARCLLWKLDVQMYIQDSQMFTYRHVQITPTNFQYVLFSYSVVTTTVFREICGLIEVPGPIYMQSGLINCPLSRIFPGWDNIFEVCQFAYAIKRLFKVSVPSRGPVYCISFKTVRGYKHPFITGDKVQALSKALCFH